MRKPRIFYLAWTPPTENGGACLAMHRHFVMRDDFELFVASSTPFKHEQISSLHIQRHPALIRLSNTRLCRSMRQFEMIVEPSWVFKQIKQALQEFSPDAIFTIPDNTISWSAYILSQQTGIPLITNFQDWWPKGQFTLDSEKPYPLVQSLIERRFSKMYRASKLAFCTSAGMKQKLGFHKNSRVLYPCPASRDINYHPNFQPPKTRQPLRLVYAGTIINAYGRSVLNLARTLRGNKDFEFHVYGPRPDWKTEDIDWMVSEGIYCGLLPYNELKSKLKEADAFLVVMTFEQQLRTMMETSFTTKFLEYSQYGKPVIIWGPDYCQPIQIAQNKKCGIPVISSQPEGVISALYDLQQPKLWTTMAKGAWQSANSIFNPESIHRIFRNSIYDVLK